MQIKDLFDPGKNIYRSIEKVITYNTNHSAAQNARLKAEIGEYIATASIEEQLEKLLTKIQTAMEQGGENEVGVWVSGFYGSGKSSFTKYLGLALDETVQIDGVRFLKYLQDRLSKPQTKALLSTVATRFPAAIVMLDLASEMLAGATMEDVASVLYFKVLQWAGYSRNLKVAALEDRMQKDGRYPAFIERIEREAGAPWTQLQNDPLVIDSLLPDIAHDFYPQLFKTATAFTTVTSDFQRSLKDQVVEMLDMIRRKSGKSHVFLIVDEVGQYVSNRPNLILNLQGLAQNLKTVGGGKAWIIGTAQQTLTEDDPRAALNSPELYKLKDRFPIQINLESNDIKEICTRRLLGKSPAGEKTLGALFDKHGQALRHNTKLEEAKYYDADFDRKTFIDLYPFLPAHFDILLHLLGQLAKSTGGIGLRSAIKVIQDILVEGPTEKAPVADQQVGWLANAVTLYDALEKDIRRAFTSVHAGVGKARLQFPHSAIHEEVAKTVAVLQILDNMPATPQNIASLMHIGIDAPSRRETVDAAIDDLRKNAYVPFGEQDGALRFFSEKLNDIDQVRAQLLPRAIEVQRHRNEALHKVFDPLPSTRLHGSFAVGAGLKVMNGANPVSLAGERETIQLVVEWVDPKGYDTVRTRLVDESRQRSAQHIIYLLGRSAPESDDIAAEIYRCKDIANRYRTDPDREVRDYCDSQLDQANKHVLDLERLFRRALSQGSFVFHGQTVAVDTLDSDLLEAAKKHLGGVAEQVFDHYGEAPVRVNTDVAEKFLRAGPKGVTAPVDPLTLVQQSKGAPQIQVDHKALTSIRDYLDRNGMVEGKRLSDTFTDAPYGWSPDTLRYLIAALLCAGEIKLKVSGREITANGQQAIDALKTNNSFKSVGVALREERPSRDSLARASKRLEGLIGEQVVPLEDDISKAATKHFPQFQWRYGSLPARLEALHLPGSEGLTALTQELADILKTDASDVTGRLGAENSALYERLQWASQVDTALKNGLENTIRDLQLHRREIERLPDTGIPAQLRAALIEPLKQLDAWLSHESFHTHAADLRSTLTAICARTRDATLALAEEQKGVIRVAQEDLANMAEWRELNQTERAQLLADLDGFVLSPSADLKGLLALLRQDYMIRTRAQEMRTRVKQLSRERQLERLRSVAGDSSEPSDGAGPREKAPTHRLTLPIHVRNAADLDRLIQRLQELRSTITLYEQVEITLVDEE